MLTTMFLSGRKWVWQGHLDGAIRQDNLDSFGEWCQIKHAEPHSLIVLIQIYYVDEILYLIVVSLTKVSILFLYLRIFPDKGFRKIAYALMGVTITYMVVFLFISIFQCWPIGGAWEKWDGTYQTKCNNVNAQGWAAAIFNIVLDLSVIVLPMRQLSRLNMNWSKKGQLLVIFGLGGL